MSRPVTGLVLVPVTPAPGMAGSAAAAAAAGAAQNDELPADTSVDAPTAVRRMVRQSAPLQPLRVQGTPPGAASEPTRPFGQPPRDTEPNSPSTLRWTGGDAGLSRPTVPLSADLAAATQPTTVVEALRQTLTSFQGVTGVSGHVGSDQRLYVGATAQNGNQIQFILPHNIAANTALSAIFQLSAVLVAPTLPQPLQVRVRFESDVAFDSECSRHGFSAVALQRAREGGIVLIRIEGSTAKRATQTDIVDDAGVVSSQRITLRDLSQEGATMFVEFILPQSAAASVEKIDRHLINAKDQLGERLRMITAGDGASVLQLFSPAVGVAAIAVLASAFHIIGGDATGSASAVLGGLVWWKTLLGQLPMPGWLDWLRGGVGPILPPTRIPATAMARIPPGSGDRTVIGGPPAVPRGPVGPTSTGRRDFDRRVGWMQANSDQVSPPTDVYVVDGHYEIQLPKQGPAMELTMGRNPDNGFQLLNEKVSRRHAIVTWDPQTRTLTATDLGSYNGTGFTQGEASLAAWSKSDDFNGGARSYQFERGKSNVTTMRLPSDIFIYFRIPE